MKPHSKNERILNLYTRFCEGKVICKAEEAERFGVDERSIQRDIDDIRAFLDERTVEGSGKRSVIYDRIQKCYRMKGAEGALMTNAEILAVSKILLESRAFTKKEVSMLLDKMIAGCVPQQNMKLVSDLIANEKFHYIELGHKSNIKDLLWDIGVAIKEHKLLDITYEKQSDSANTVHRLVEPLSILFSEYYFYLLANPVERDEAGTLRKLYGYPTVFRIDRIKTLQCTGETFRIEYKDRFEEGEFRKRIQFMYAGELMRVRFRFTGTNIEPVLDRLPTAKIISQSEEGYLIEVESYGKGLMMWLFSQGERVEVLSPTSFREDMKEHLQKMLEKYE